MRVEYTFSVTGHIRIDRHFRFPLRSRTYALQCDAAGYLSEIRIAVPNVPRAAWPRVTETPNNPVKAHIVVPSEPQLASIKAELRNLEALLGVYGLREINTARGQTRWIPETAGEAKALHLYSFAFGAGDMRNHENPTIDPNVLLQAVIAAPEASSHEIPLNFFRKGCQDLEQERFIDAIYDFYFCLETMYGAGHTKNYKVSKAFKACHRLRDAIHE